jgi:hypothetical protein
VELHPAGLHLLQRLLVVGLPEFALFKLGFPGQRQDFLPTAARTDWGPPPRQAIPTCW